MLRMEIGRRQEGMGQNQEAGNFLGQRNNDLSLADVTADGDQNFLEKDFQIQTQSQRNKKDTNRKKSVGTHDAKMAKEPLNPNNLVSKLLLEENS